MRTTILSPEIFAARHALLWLTTAFLLLCSVPGADAIALNAHEQALADALVNAGGQNRGSMQMDPILTQVARSRAVDMARRRYFSHVNPDGNGPNYIVEAAGYPLPDWWGDDRAKNYVESIAAGQPTAGGTWSDFMSSSAHKTHLLAESSFYRDQTAYGIGYYSDPRSEYITYWVVITAPPRPLPTLTIKSPTAGARVSSPQVTVAGSVSGGSIPASVVQIRVDNATGNGSFRAADGVGSWSGEASLAYGANTIRVRCLDTSGTILAEAERVVRLVILAPLTVSVAGEGSVSSKFMGTTDREVGRTYTITATPAADAIFAGWSGGISSAKSTVTFTMTEGMAFTASFVPNPFLARRGSYTGIVAGTAGRSPSTSGALTIALGGSGSFTGKLALGGENYPLSGQFSLSGAAVLEVVRAGEPPLKVELQLDVTARAGITANINIEGEALASATASSTFRFTAAPFAHAGRYTISLPPDDSGAAPQGNGYATLTVSKGGAAKIVAFLADGARFSRSGKFSEAGELAIYAPLYGDRGLAIGQLRVAASSVSDMEGALHWSKPATLGDRYYAEGFSTALPVVGSRYVPPSPGTPVVQVVNAENNSALALGDGNLEAPVLQRLTLDESNRVRVEDPTLHGLSIKILPASGTFTGVFRDPESSEVRQLRGVIFQKQNAGYGYFLGSNESGYSSLTPAF